MQKVFALGSCRLIEPVKLLVKRGTIHFTNQAQSWYAHTTKEMLQRLDHMQGHARLPDALLPLILDQDSCKTAPADCAIPFVLPAIGIFEISSRNIRWHAGYALHSTLLRKRQFADTTDRIAPFTATEADIVALRARFRHLIIGCNIVYGSNLTDPDVNRQKLNDFLKSMAQKYEGIQVVDPNDTLDPAQDLRDRDHYNANFVPRLADIYAGVLAQYSNAA
mgnify:CR=1 FL=1